MKIINLHAENFKRLSAVDITPDSDVVILSGANEQGKSSVLDAIMAAIAGGRGMKEMPEPVKRGEESAEVSLDLGDIKVKRQWSADGRSRIEVTNADGAKFSTPQGILDSMTGSLTFDPLEFARMAPRDQRATLLRLVNLPFDIDENDARRKELVTAESAARKNAQRSEDDVSALPDIPPDTPDEEVSASELYGKLTKIREIMNENDKKRRELSDARDSYSRKEATMKVAESRVESLEDQLKKANADLAAIRADLAEQKDAGERLAADVEALQDPDTSEIDQQLASVDKVNFNVRQKQTNDAAKKAFKEAQAAAEAAKKAVVDHDKVRSEALAAAKFPVDGLGFDEAGVTLNGLAFAQASESQRIMTSVAMGVAINPKLRVMFVRDGSALDSKRMAALSELAADQDFQLWVEKVDESGTIGIVIEDGRVKGAGEEISE